jgi:hypothetical protein
MTKQIKSVEDSCLRAHSIQPNGECLQCEAIRGQVKQECSKLVEALEEIDEHYDTFGEEAHMTHKICENALKAYKERNGA